MFSREADLGLGKIAAAFRAQCHGDGALHPYICIAGADCCPRCLEAMLCWRLTTPLGNCMLKLYNHHELLHAACEMLTSIG